LNKCLKCNVWRLAVRYVIYIYVVSRLRVKQQENLLHCKMCCIISTSHKLSFNNNNNNNNNNNLADMALGHLLNCSSLTHLKGFLMVSPGLCCLLGCSFFFILSNLLLGILFIIFLCSNNTFFIEHMLKFKY
jgi:hypothetical protein